MIKRPTLLLRSRRRRFMSVIKSMGPTAYYPFDEVSGTVAMNDAPATFNTNNGVITGNGVTGQLGRLGSSYAFDGATDDVTIPTQMFYQDAAYSLHFMVNGPVGTGRVLCLGSTGANTQVWIMEANGAGKLNMLVRNDANGSVVANVTTTLPVFNNTWNSVVFTDNNGAGKMYVNGVLDPTNYNYTKSGVYTFNRTGIGALVRAAVSSWLTGNVQHVGIFRGTILTPEQVKQLAVVAGV